MQALRFSLLLSLIVFVVGCGSERPPLEGDVENLRLIREADGTQVLSGIVVNTSERPLRAARITVGLYQNGENGRPVETITFEVPSIDAQESKPFRQVLDTYVQLSSVSLEQLVLF